MHIDPNEEQLAFYFHIGLAITQWAHVEFALAWLVAWRLNSNDQPLNVAGFLSIENLRTKLQYADTILSASIQSDTSRADWATLRDRIGQLAKKRNRLAHSWVLTDGSSREGRQRMLLPTKPPPDNKPKTRGHKYHGAICLRDIVGFRLEFVALMCAIENYDCRLAGRKERFPKSLEQPKHPPTLAKIRREIYAYAQRPPKPSRT